MADSVGDRVRCVLLVFSSLTRRERPPGLVEMGIIIVGPPRVLFAATFCTAPLTFGITESAADTS